MKLRREQLAERADELKAVLNCRMQPNDADAPTVGVYLMRLAQEVWREGEGFSGKRPFGNSGWEYEVELALATAGLIRTEGTGPDMSWSYKEARALVLDAAEYLELILW